MARPLIPFVQNGYYASRNWIPLVKGNGFTTSGGGEQEEVWQTASGSIVTFDAVAAPLRQLTVAVEPVQNGTGDPSPTNVRPITGWDSVTVNRTGVNVWDEEWELGGVSNQNGTLWAATDRIRSKNFIPCLPNTEYYLKCPTVVSAVAFYDADNTFISALANFAGNATFTTPSNAKYIKFGVAGAYGPTYNNDISINYPATDTEYHAYQGNTYTIQLGETVYGGTLDVVNGKMTVDRVCKTFDGTETFTGDGGAGAIVPRWADVKVAGPIYFGFGLSNLLKRANSYNAIRNTALSMTVGSGFYILINPYGTVYQTQADASTEAKQWCTDMYNAGTPLQVCYELATPITLTLTPEQISTLQGTNNVWSDAGNVTVEYRAQ